MVLFAVSNIIEGEIKSENRVLCEYWTCLVKKHLSTVNMVGSVVNSYAPLSSAKCVNVNVKYLQKSK